MILAMTITIITLGSTVITFVIATSNNSIIVLASLIVCATCFGFNLRGLLERIIK